MSVTSKVLVNIDDSHTGGIPFSSTTIPNGSHTLPAPGSNIQSAASIYPCAQKGGKINRRKINKISRKYKMKGSRRTIRRRIRRIKTRKHMRRHRKSGKRMMSRGMRGGAASAPIYPAGHNQYDLNKIVSNTYSLGGILPAGFSALATPPPYQKGMAEVDNLNHNAPNLFGNTGAGSGFPSRGWF